MVPSPYILMVHGWRADESSVRVFLITVNCNLDVNKKVLLRERKRYTACRVVSTPSVVLTGYPVAGYPLSWPGRGVPYLGTPWQGTPGRVPPSWPGRGGTLPGGYPTWVPPAGYPLAGYPPAGYPPYWPGWGGFPTWVPPGQGTPWQGYPPGRVPPILTWLGTPLGKAPPPSRVPPPGRVPPGRVPPPPAGPGRVPAQLDLAGYPPRCLPMDSILGNVAKHYGIWVPPRRCLLHGILGNVAKHYGIWVPPPPGVNKLTKWNYYLPVVLRTRAVIKAFPITPKEHGK